MLSLIENIIRREIGGTLKQITPLTGGSDNIVYRAVMPNSDLVIRLHKDYAAMYREEVWAMERAGEAGVPVPDVYAVGALAGYDYMIMDFVDGAIGTEEAGDMMPIHRECGRLARLINGIEVDGFGREFSDEPRPHFSQSWRGVVDGDIDYIFGGDTLAPLRILSDAQLVKARDIIAAMRDWDVPPRLSHADICLDNIIIDPKGAVWLIDWSKASGVPAPYFDVGEFANWVDDGRRFAAFLEGYGLGRSAYEGMKQQVFCIGLMAVLRGLVWAKKDWPMALDAYISRARELARYL